METNDPKTSNRDLESRPGVDPPPVDAAHLDRVTFGDPQLRIEVLLVFRRTAAICLARLREARGAEARAAAAHSLLGAARAIGAAKLAARAAEIEEGAELDDARLGRLAAEVAEIDAFIDMVG